MRSRKRFWGALFWLVGCLGIAYWWNQPVEISVARLDPYRVRDDRLLLEMGMQPKLFRIGETTPYWSGGVVSVVHAPAYADGFLTHHRGRRALGGGLLEILEVFNLHSWENGQSLSEYQIAEGSQARIVSRPPGVVILEPQRNRPAKLARFELVFYDFGTGKRSTVLGDLTASKFDVSPDGTTLHLFEQGPQEPGRNTLRVKFFDTKTWSLLGEVADVTTTPLYSNDGTFVLCELHPGRAPTVREGQVCQLRPFQQGFRLVGVGGISGTFEISNHWIRDSAGLIDAMTGELLLDAKEYETIRLFPDGKHAACRNKQGIVFYHDLQSRTSRQMPGSRISTVDRFDTFNWPGGKLAMGAVRYRRLPIFLNPVRGLIPAGILDFFEGTKTEIVDISTGRTLCTFPGSLRYLAPSGAFVIIWRNDLHSGSKRIFIYRIDRWCPGFWQSIAITGLGLILIARVGRKRSGPTGQNEKLEKDSETQLHSEK